MAIAREPTTAGLLGAPRRPPWRRAAAVVRRFHDRVWSSAADLLPKGLYARALIIIIAPIVMLEGVVAFVFMERHWQQVNQRLAEQTARNIAAVIDLYDEERQRGDLSRLTKLARDRLNLSIQVMPRSELPPPLPKPFFGLLDRTLSTQLRRHIGRPVWIDTIGQSSHVEIRVLHEAAILRFIVTRNQTYASNSHIFLAWMVGTSVVLLTVAILFLRNQITPIQRLADAADALGKGRPIPADFRPRGAREVRKAAMAFIEMGERIRTHVDQRTTLLAGVSHDLRTVLTRFKLELALMGDTPAARSLTGYVDDMHHVLEDYLAFARGDGGEEASPTDLRDVLEEVVHEAETPGRSITLKMRRRRPPMLVPLKRHAFKRALTNLVSNAVRYGDIVLVRVAVEREWVRVEIEDNGPGIPEAERENVFRPFYRLDGSRNQNSGHSGLGLAIARDIAKGHGGDITLADGVLGGLKAIVRVPL
jgi:two-component system osmolarity sensor histidine kinase EnvZ